jgi:hypothetical protein
MLIYNRYKPLEKRPCFKIIDFFLALPYLYSVYTCKIRSKIQNMRTKHLKQHSLRQMMIITSWFIKESVDLMWG